MKLLQVTSLLLGMVADIKAITKIQTITTSEGFTFQIDLGNIDKV